MPGKKPPTKNKECRVTLLPFDIIADVPSGSNLLDAVKSAILLRVGVVIVVTAWITAVSFLVIVIAATVLRGTAYVNGGKAPEWTFLRKNRWQLSLNQSG